MINDISERLQWERQLQNFNQDLEQKVQERTRELETEVAERQQTQELLRESEARTRAIVNSAADGIITTNDLGIITGFNAAAEKIFGHSVSDAMGKSVNILLPEEVAGDHDGFIGNFLKTGDAKIIGIGREVEGRRKDGSSFPMELALSATDITGGTIFTGIVRDISERKEAEDKLHHTLDELRQTQDVLVQSEKMASLGGLVAGVAHEINTPVGIGVTASSHLSEAVGNLRRSFAGGTLKKSELEASFETIDQASEMISTNLRRAAELIGSFKQVAVDQSSEEKREFQVGEYLDEIILSLHPKIKQTKHRVSVDCDSSLLVNSYPGAISQIITNLVMNSLIHAYDDGDEGSIRISALDNGDHITLKYFDDGKGMDTESLKKIFDPFFTTKRGSGGSGLGMNILYNLVTQTLGGTVVCDSQPGEGTTFTITFSNKEKPPLEQRAAG